MKKIKLVQGFYLLSLMVLTNVSPTIIHENKFSEPQWLWPMAWWGKPISQEFVFFLTVAIFFIFLLGFLFSQFWTIRILGACAWLFTIALLYPNGSISNGVLLWSATSIVFALPFLSLESETRIIKIAQAYALSAYFSSGLWKIRSLIDAFQQDTLWNSLSQSVTHSMASNQIMGVGNQTFLNFTSQYPVFSAAVWISIILFQISTILGTLLPRTIFWLGLLIIAFHFSVAISMRTQFSLTSLLIIYLFYLAPNFHKELGNTQKSRNEDRAIMLFVFLSSVFVSHSLENLLIRNMLIPHTSWRLYSGGPQGITGFDVLIEHRGQSYLLSKSKWISESVRSEGLIKAQIIGNNIEDQDLVKNLASSLREQLKFSEAKTIGISEIYYPYGEYMKEDQNESKARVKLILEFSNL